ncbi:unnamed protein product [Phytomonas sp. EM1]|nr:unnamed protein product [Phytomonas sp. EM1]|eukprot:CCW61222.1 unnamed protein product [Phytomonas sp. isolate EM1]
MSFLGTNYCVLIRLVFLTSLLSLFFVSLAQVTASGPQTPPPLRRQKPNERINNWVVIVGGARYYFNYRHTLNSLAIYNIAREHGIDDDHILFFSSDGIACDPRNPYAAAVQAQFGNNAPMMNLYNQCTRVDFFGDNVDVRTFLDVLQGRYDENTPETRRLRTDANSNILLYFTGHSAKGYFKFQDSEYLSGVDLSESLAMMHTQGRYHKILILADTCKALALCNEITAPNVVCLASSNATMDSFSEHFSKTLGVSVVSRWTFEILKILEGAGCAAPSPGETEEPPRRVSVMHQSVHSFNYNPFRRELEGDPSEPAHRDASNDAGAIHRWLMAEFLCPSQAFSFPIEVRYDLF